MNNLTQIIYKLEVESQELKEDIDNAIKLMEIK